MKKSNDITLARMKMVLIEYQTKKRLGMKVKLNELQDKYKVGHFPKYILNGICDVTITDDIVQDIRHKASRKYTEEKSEDPILEKIEDITAAELVARLESLGYKVRLFKTQYVEVDVNHIIRDNHKCTQGNLFNEEEIR